MSQPMSVAASLPPARKSLAIEVLSKLNPLAVWQLNIR